MRALDSRGISSVRINPELLEMAKAAAADRGITLNEIIGKALQGYLET